MLVMGFQKKSKNMTDKYRLHLSIADLLFVLTLPFWAVDAASGWLFRGFLCVTVNMIYTLNLYSSVLILAFISLDRYLAVVRATNSQSVRRLLAEKVIYLGVWLPATLLTVPDLVFATVHSTGTNTICELTYPQQANTVWKDRFPFPAPHHWLFAAWSGHSDLLLYHHLKTVQELQRSGPEEEGAEDNDHPHPLLLHLLVALLHRHPSGHSGDAECHISQLFSGAGSGEMDLFYRAACVFPLLSQPHPLCVPGSQIQ